MVKFFDAAFRYRLMLGYKWRQISQLLLPILLIFPVTTKKLLPEKTVVFPLGQWGTYAGRSVSACVPNDHIVDENSIGKHTVGYSGYALSRKETLRPKTHGHEEDMLPSDVILWTQTRILGWTDFKAAPETQINVDALSSCGIVMTPKVISTRYLEFEVNCYFSPHDSWAKDWNVSKALLRHEQAHFDLGEIYARHLRLRLKESRFSKKNLDKQISRVYNDVFSEYNSMQRQYDRATNHSLNPAVQQQWEELIAERLRTSGKHADFVFQVPLY